MRNLHQKLGIARGERPAELLFKNASRVNVFSGEIYRIHVAVEDCRVVGPGDYEAKNVVDLARSYLAPSLIDGHFHIESSMLTAPEFAGAVVPHGTGAVVIDPHEYANMLGFDGIRYVLESTKNLPVDFFIMLPSCVPATPLETAGARLTADDLKLMIGDERNLAQLLPVINALNSVNCSYATDDKLAGDFVNEGHIDHAVRKSIRLGLPPMTALQIASINTARHYRLRNHGAIAPRYWADFIVFDDLQILRVGQTWKKGVLVAENGKYLARQPAAVALPRSTMNLRYQPTDLEVKPAGGGRIRVIEIVPNQIVSREIIEPPNVVNGLARIFHTPIESATA